LEKIEFSHQEKLQLVQRVKLYFAEELDQEIGSFDAEFLIDFFAEELGVFFYNRGLYDAEAKISEKLADLAEELLQLERPLPAK